MLMVPIGTRPGRAQIAGGLAAAIFIYAGRQPGCADCAWLSRPCPA